MARFWEQNDIFFSFRVFETDLLGNSLVSYVLALVSTILLFSLFRFFSHRLLARLEKGSERTATRLDDTSILILRSIRPPFYLFFAFYIPLKFLELQPFLEKLIDTTLIALLVYQTIQAAHIFISYLVHSRLIRGDETRANASADLLSLCAKFALWTLGVLLVLSNLGLDITSLIAGLGIGGVAVALALQNILGDLFSSFALHFDKPFRVGDFIIVGDKMGVVQKIGIKTTRIRALQGEELVISNQELTTSKIQNFKHMQERRVVFGFGVAYETPLEKLRRIPDMLQTIVVAEKLARFDRAHFQKFASSSLDFEVVYFIQSADYNVYMDTQQSLNFKIMEVFEEERISFAYPTQTLYVRNAHEQH